MSCVYAVGKRLRDALYVHSSATNVLSAREQRLVIEAAELVDNLDFDDDVVIKIFSTGRAVSFNVYPSFRRERHPALSRSIHVDLGTNKVTERRYRNNRPILHRKELFVSRTDPDWQRFAAETRADEEAGLFEDPSIIGTESQWFELRRRLGLE